MTAIPIPTSLLRARRRLRTAALAALLVTAVAPGQASAASADRIAKLIEDADRKAAKHQYQRAVRLYARADEAAGGESLEAVAGLARSSFLLLRYDDTIEAAERWLRMADTPESRVDADLYLGLGLHGRGLTERWGQPPGATAAGAGAGGRRRGDDTLRAAADALRRVVEAYDEDAARLPSVLLYLADTLVWLDQRAEAAAVLDRYAAAGGADPYAGELRCWAGGGEDEEEPEDDDGSAASARPTQALQVEPPVKIYAPAPRYPPELRPLRIKSQVVLQSIVTKEGRVACLRPLAGHPYPFVRAAMTTVRTWRFRPAMMAGQPVAVYYNLTLSFGVR